MASYVPIVPIASAIAAREVAKQAAKILLVPTFLAAYTVFQVTREMTRLVKRGIDKHKH